jgi:hypothetical protein
VADRHLHISGCAKLCALSSDATCGVSSQSAPGQIWLHARRRRAARLPNGPALTAGSALPAEYSNNSMTYHYEKCGEEIYRQSFSIIRREADLKRFNPVEERVACRMIHAAGMVELAQHIHFSADFAQAAEAAPQRGAPMLCDARMVSEGITRKRLPADNPIICTLQDARVGWPRPWATPAAPPRWSCGANIWTARWSPSAMRRPRCFIC